MFLKTTPAPTICKPMMAMVLPLETLKKNMKLAQGGSPSQRLVTLARRRCGYIHAETIRMWTSDGATVGNGNHAEQIHYTSN